MNVQQLLESSNQFKQVSDDAKRLSDKWVNSGLLEGISNKIDQNTMSMLLENQAKQLITEGNVTGGTASMSGGSYNSENWAGVALPLVRRVFGQIAAKEFLSVQPMNLPSGLVFYLDFKYGTTKQPYTSGTSLYGANATTNVTDIAGGLYEAGKFSYSYNSPTASVTFSTGSVSFSDVNYDGAFVITGSLTKVTVAAGQLTSISSSFDTNGIRSFVVTSGSNALVATNILQQFTSFTAGGALTLIVSGSTGLGGTTGTLTYNKVTAPESRGDFEDGGSLSQADPISIPEINVQLKSEAIVAKTRKLKAQWTPEFAQDLNAYQSLDAEAELTSIMSEYIALEIDLENLDMLIQDASAADEYWSAVNNKSLNSAKTGYDNLGFYNTQGQWFQTLGTKFQKVSNKIHQKTLRGGANFMVCSPAVATILESIPGFASSSDGDVTKANYAFGIQKSGNLNNRYTVYKNPYMTENVILMGYRGAQFLETGAVFAPYVPLIMTPLVYDPETFTPRKGLLTRYAKKMIRPEFYGRVFVSDLASI